MRRTLTVLTLVVALPLPAAAAADPTVIRLAGVNRYSTAVEISEFHFPSGAATVFVATGTAFPDGLAGAAVAGLLDAPLLLTDPNNLPPETEAEIERLNPDNIVILGGASAVSQGVEDELALIATVTRLAGSNRYLTAVEVSQYGYPGTATTVVVATGTGFADALAGGPAAVALGGPLLLTQPDVLPTAVATEIARLAPDQIILLGGTGAVSAEVETSLEGFAEVTRISGADRYLTSVEIAQLAFPSADRVYVATGLNFPDALAGAAAAAGYGAPILLTATNSVTDAVRTEVAQFAPAEVVILGGTAVVGLTAEHRLAFPTLPTLAEIEIDLVELEDGFDDPLLLVDRPGDARLFVVGQNGQVWSMPVGGGSHTEVLDVTSIATGSESGLLSIAFHPGDATRMFIAFTDDNVTNDIVVREYSFPIGPATVVDPAPVATVITVPHPSETNHNGGMILFGPDGYLYITMGDGGGGGDPFDNGQDTDALLGSILRIDVDSLPYDIPSTNPYADGEDGAPEVWVKGMRNPWRISWDGDDLYVADVGQGEREELSVLGPDSGGANLGWNILEGTDCYTTGSPLCAVNDFVDPVIEYAHVSGTCAITGGYVYRGPVTNLGGIYFYADYCQGNIRALRMYQGALVDTRTFADDPGSVTGFGIDGSGRVYVTSFANGTVYRIDLGI